MREDKAPTIPPDEEIPFMNVDETDFASLERGEQIRRFEVDGYVVLRSVLSAAQVARLKGELADAEMDHKSYSTQQTFSVTQPQWLSAAAAELIAHPPVTEFLRALLGPDVLFTRGFFQRTLPGSPGISMHTDGQPHGSSILATRAAPRDFYACSTTWTI